MRFRHSLIACAFAVVPLRAATISTFAGTGAKGFSGDGGPATSAQLSNPSAIARGPDGALYICDTDNQRIRKVAPDGTISTVAGNGTRGFSGDGGPATQAALNEPYELRWDQGGNMFFVERLNHLIRRVDAKTGVISTIAGKGKAGFSGDGGPATSAELNQPHSLVFDQAGDLVVCDIGNNRLRRIDMKTGTISTFSGSGEKKPTPDGALIADTPLSGPRALDVDGDGNLWLALREGNAIYRLDVRAGKLHHVAGTGKSGFTGNGGPAKSATLSGPKCVSVAPDGDVYFADTESHSIRRLDLARGTVELVAGTGVKGDSPDGSQLARPHGIFVDKDGAIFIGDSENNRVRVIRR